jgi:hypothetical protein
MEERQEAKREVRIQRDRAGATHAKLKVKSREVFYLSKMGLQLFEVARYLKDVSDHVQITAENTNEEVLKQMEWAKKQALLDQSPIKKEDLIMRECFLHKETAEDGCSICTAVRLHNLENRITFVEERLPAPASPDSPPSDPNAPSATPPDRSTP